MIPPALALGACFLRGSFAGDRPRGAPFTGVSLRPRCQEQMISAGFVPVGWAQPVSTLANLANLRGPAARAAEAKKILDRAEACKKPPKGRRRPWMGHGL